MANTNNTGTDSTQNPAQNNVQKSKSRYTRDPLIEAYVGPNYDKISVNPFNIPAFFFAPFYLFYRKMPLYGLIVLVLDMVIIFVGNVIHNTPLMTFLNAILNIGVAFGVNYVYIQTVKKRILKIRDTNPHASPEEIRGICSAKGGTSGGLLALSIVLYIFAFIITFVALIINGFASNSTVDNGNITISYSSDGATSNDSENGDNPTYDGVFAFDTTIKIQNEFDIDVPNPFEILSTNYGAYTYEYESDDFTGTCKVEISSPKDYHNAENLIQQLIKYNADDSPSDITKERINGITWYWFDYDDTAGRTYTFATTKDDKVFMLDYEITNVLLEECDSYTTDILNNIKPKKTSNSDNSDSTSNSSNQTD